MVDLSKEKKEVTVVLEAIISAFDMYNKLSADDKYRCRTLIDLVVPMEE